MQGETETRKPCLVLGVTGGVAAYKSADLASCLTKAGIDVDVVMTESACEFVTPMTYQTVTGRTVYTSLWKSWQSKPDHIALADRPDLILIAPATANTLAKYARGIADNLLLTTLLATSKPVWVAPAMNPKMWAHPATCENMEILKERGVRVLGPAEGRVACGDTGVGRMVEPGELFDEVRAFLLD